MSYLPRIPLSGRGRWLGVPTGKSPRLQFPASVTTEGGLGGPALARRTGGEKVAVSDTLTLASS